MFHDCFTTEGRDKKVFSGRPLSWGRRGTSYRTTGVTGDEHRRSVAVSYNKIIVCFEKFLAGGAAIGIS